MNKTDKSIIFYAESMEALARQVAVDKDLECGKIEWGTFKDKWPNFFIKDVEKIRGHDIIFFIALTEPADVFSQLCVLYQLPEKKIGDLHIILPYYPVGTMDRANKEGEIITAQVLAQMLSGIPLTQKGGRHLLTVFDIHALQERSYFNGNVIFDAQSAIPLLLSEVQRFINGDYDYWSDFGEADKHEEGIAVALPDEGAFKRFGKELPDWLHIIKCDKVRRGKERIIVVKEGDPHGKYVIILDDLVNSGETLIQCRHKLIELGAIKVSAFVPHGVFPEKAWEKIKPELFDKFWITDSCPATVKAVRGKKPFHIISLAQLIGGII